MSGTPGSSTENTFHFRKLTLLNLFTHRRHSLLEALPLSDFAHLNMTPSHVTPATGLKRLGFLALAYGSLAFAFLGLIIPGLPTTEFVLLCAWASAKSSPRLSRWLEQHRVLGPLLHNWRNGGVINRKSKLVASLSMSLCLAILIWHQPPLWLLVSAGLGMGSGALWIWSRPEQIPGHLLNGPQFSE